jgi:hypothetical protein
MKDFVIVLFLLCCMGGIISWVISVIHFNILRSYAVSQGLNPAHFWKLFGPIWQDVNHPKHRSLKALRFWTIMFFACIGIGMLVGALTGGEFTHKP